jgi:flagellar biogenesis protein FliO
MTSPLQHRAARGFVAALAAVTACGAAFADRDPFLETPGLVIPPPAEFAPAPADAAPAAPVAAPAPAALEALPLGPKRKAPPAPVNSTDDAAPPRRETLGFGLPERAGEMLRVGAALGAVVLLAVLARFVLGRPMAGGGAAARPSGVLEILARYPIGRSQALVLLKLGQRIVLMHHAGSAATALTEVVEPDEVAALLARMEAGARSRDARRFASILRGFEREHERGAARMTMPPRADGDAVEIVDLTRGQGRGLAALFRSRRPGR